MQKNNKLIIKKEDITNYKKMIVTMYIFKMICKVFQKMIQHS